MASEDSPSSPVEALITDLDGTFWSRQMEVHEKSLTAVEKLDEARIPFVVATGRRAQGALLGLTPVGLHTRPGILMNGALAREHLSGESFLVNKIETADGVDVLNAFRAGDVEPVIYVDHPTTDMLVGPGGGAGEEYLARTVGFERVDSLEASLEEHAVIGFGAFGFEYDQLHPISEAINAAGLATGIIGESLYEGNHGLMIQGHEIDKQTGIEAWCTRVGVDPTRLAVVGDGHNDIEMLQNAQVAIVPANASQEIRGLADVIIAPNEEGGWEQISQILGL